MTLGFWKNSLYSSYTPDVGIGVKQRCETVEFSPGDLHRAKMRGELTEDLI